MIKEFIKNKLYKLLELDKFYNLKDAIILADTSNQKGIEFCLDNIKVKDNFFNEYKWDRYIDLPWYIRKLFDNKYNTFYRHDSFMNWDEVYIDDTWIANAEYPVGRILEKIALYKKKKDKK